MLETRSKSSIFALRLRIRSSTWYDSNCQLQFRFLLHSAPTQEFQLIRFFSTPRSDADSASTFLSNKFVIQLMASDMPKFILNFKVEPLTWPVRGGELEVNPPPPKKLLFDTHALFSRDNKKWMFLL